MAGAALCLCLLLLPVVTLADEEDRLSIRGRVIDETGAGVPGQVARLLKSRTYMKVGGLRSLDQSVEETRATTDALGFFEIENGGYLFHRGQLANRVRLFPSDSPEAFPVLESARHVSLPQPHSVHVRPASRVSRTRSDTATSISHLQYALPTREAEQLVSKDSSVTSPR
jgi:hypothetical protein